jgi:hypothetical protein
LPPLTPAQRSARARLAVNTRWARATDRQTTARSGQAGLLARFEAQIPAEITDPAERTRRALQLRLAHMQRMALASSKARAARKAAGDATS